LARSHDRLLQLDAVGLMDTVLSSALRDGIYGWLKRALIVSRDADMPSRAALAEVEMPRLIAALSALLDEHEPDEGGRCPRCSRRRRRGVQCSVWVTAYGYLIGNDVERDAGGRHAWSTGGRS
jgi:hypothetical protein